MTMQNPSEIASPRAESTSSAAVPSPLRGKSGLLTLMRQWIERMSATRANGQAGLVSDVTISFALIAAGLWRSDVRPVPAVLTVLLGLVLFSFVEYCFHRWLFHGRAQILEQGHRKHHEQPEGYDALPFFVPPLAALMLAYLFGLVLPASIALLLSGSLAAGYAAYGLSHTAIHNIRFRHPLGQRWAASHHIHHYHPDKNFGVTTPLWDVLLGTKYMSSGKGPKRRETIAGTEG